jgi:hypothetical protein
MRGGRVWGLLQTLPELEKCILRGTEYQELGRLCGIVSSYDKSLTCKRKGTFMLRMPRGLSVGSGHFRVYRLLVAILVASRPSNSRQPRVPLLKTLALKLSDILTSLAFTMDTTSHQDMEYFLEPIIFCVCLIPRSE